MKTYTILFATAATFVGAVPASVHPVRTANATIPVVRASSAASSFGTVKRDFPTAPCPAYNSVTLSDDLGGAISSKYNIACDHALDGETYSTVEENGSTSGVSIIDCLSTCDWNAVTTDEGCCGAIIDPDGVCQIVSGTCYGLTKAAGYQTFNYEGLS
ncbi:hypothetical protein Tdes44962_MAKER01204 [Teratosphaeria destructans]|uniref:Uncharacterized protein n=1 Tax=Teratosphaeria destructans TaxID=418781 RepID=A0A9W7T1I2_9PEZI|nr:hypothetical protein Tdes44962_MAKER01204 [Teratosphaeria destructans]